MGDKECASYEAMANSGQQHQKTASTTIQLPVLTSKPVKQQQGGLTKDSPSEPQSSGYYLNVAQKGKLILPTALWLLLIVAGISFLTLLASLNKTVDTLDTLIELEQEKEARQERLHHIRDSINEHHHSQHASNNKQARDDNKADLFDWRHSKKDQDDVYQHERLFRDGPSRAFESNGNQDRFLDSLVPIKASWFALPSWTSLEPSASSGLRVEQPPMMRAKPARHHEHRKLEVHPSDENRPPMPPQIENMMDDMMRQMMALDSPGRVVSESAAPEISGSFIVSSSSDLGMKIRGESGSNMDNKPTDFMDSIMKQIMPMLSGGLTDLPNEMPGKKDKATKNEEPHQTMGPMISAKIDNLNINLNDGSSNNDDDANEGSESEDKKSTSNRRPTASERNEIEELEKSIDSMVSKLMNRKSNEMPLILDLNANEAKPLVQDHFSLRPIGSESKAHHGNHHHHSKPSDEFKSSQMFPLPKSSFLMPFDFSSSPSSPSPKEATTLTKLLSINKDQDQNETDADKAAVEQVFKELKDQLEFGPLSGQPASLVADQTFGEPNNSPSFPSIDPLSVFVIPSQAPELDQTKGPSEPKETASKDSAESLMNDFIGSMFTMPQFDGGNQRQVSTSGGDSSSGGSSSGGSSSSAGSSGGSSSPSDEFEANPDDQFEMVDLDEFLNGGLALPQSEDQQMDFPSEPETIEYQFIE